MFYLFIKEVNIKKYVRVYSKIKDVDVDDQEIFFLSKKKKLYVLFEY